MLSTATTDPGSYSEPHPDAIFFANPNSSAAARPPSRDRPLCLLGSVDRFAAPDAGSRSDGIRTNVTNREPDLPDFSRTDRSRTSRRRVHLADARFIHPGTILGRS